MTDDWRPSANLDVLRARADVCRTVREFFHARGVVEAFTPTLGRYTVTDPDVDGIEVPGYGYLQTSPEYFLKRLLAAGAPSCYQLAPAFRAGERGSHHNPEFLMLEWYRLGFDHESLMAEVADLVNEVLGAQPFTRTPYSELVSDLSAARDVLDLEFAESCAALTGRHFIVDYPADQAALSRLNPDNASVAARFELVVDGVEIANGYWELADADEHRRRFALDLVIREERNKPTPEVDEPFLRAIEHGLPDCAGVALGVDRLVMLAAGCKSLDEVLAFRE